MGEPPKFDTPNQLVTWIIAMVVLTILGIIVKRFGGPPAPPPVPSAERVQLEAAAKISTAGVPDETVAFLARLYADVAELRRERDADREYIEALDDHIDDLEQGVIAGRYPPFKKRPQRTGSTLT